VFVNRVRTPPDDVNPSKRAAAAHYGAEGDDPFEVVVASAERRPDFEGESALERT
jgi:hypothetical protein